MATYRPSQSDIFNTIENEQKSQQKTNLQIISTDRSKKASTPSTYRKLRKKYPEPKNVVFLGQEVPESEFREVAKEIEFAKDPLDPEIALISKLNQVINGDDLDSSLNTLEKCIFDQIYDSEFQGSEQE